MFSQTFLNRLKHRLNKYKITVNSFEIRTDNLHFIWYWKEMRESDEVVETEKEPKALNII